jgi:hypothetical protein
MKPHKHKFVARRPKAQVLFCTQCSQFRHLITIKEQIAGKFYDLLKQELSADEWREMVRRNTQEPEYADHGACASHDFLDANMVMDAAFRAVGISPFDGDHISDEATDIWNAAWDMFRERLEKEAK